MNNEPYGWVISNMAQGMFYKEKPKGMATIPLYTHPAKEKYLSLQKVDGELVAVTYTDDEHRIVEVLWERPPAKTLTDRITELEKENEELSNLCFEFGILRKAQE